MSPLKQRISTLADTRLAAIADRTAKLKAQLLELECLREQLGRAVRSPPKKSSRLKRCNRRGGGSFSEISH
jgi:hypothetical protein